MLQPRHPFFEEGFFGPARRPSLSGALCLGPHASPQGALDVTLFLYPFAYFAVFSSPTR
jgi:hypothetical protein